MLKDFQAEIKTLLIVALIAVALSVVGVFFLRELSPAPVVQPIANNQQLTIDTSGWQTYRNDEFGFEFQYPKVFDEYSGCELRDILGDQTLTLGNSISIFVESTEGLSLEEYVNRNFSSESQFDISRRDIQVGGKDAIQIGSRTEGLGRYSEITYVLDQDKVYIFTYQARPNCLLYEVSNESELSVLQQILATFRFVE